VTQNPARARAFERLGIDYCCGGKKTLADACAARGVDLDRAIGLIDEQDARPDAHGRDPSSMPLIELIDDIEQRHHARLRTELPRLDRLTERVLNAHGDRDARLAEIRRVFLALKDELESHLDKEERVLFPIIRELESTGGSVVMQGSLRAPLERLESEHTQAGNALTFLRAATDDYTPPERACNTWKVMIDSLAALEHDMHEHVHKENNVLFPRALALEDALRARDISSGRAR
jgi:regulator of cell morphogenesis and NO signaling